MPFQQQPQRILFNPHNKTSFTINSIISNNSEPPKPFQGVVQLTIIEKANPQNRCAYGPTSINKLVITRDENKIKHLYKDENYSFLNINNGSVSKEHCILEAIDNTLLLGDIVSSNYTFIKLRNDEFLRLYPKSFFTFMGIYFSIQDIYKEGNIYSIDLVYGGEKEQNF